MLTTTARARRERIKRRQSSTISTNRARSASTRNPELWKYAMILRAMD
jgi:hypothetical protein